MYLVAWRQLLAFAEEYGEQTTTGETVIPVRLTQSDGASLVGASRVRVNQVLSFYQQRRIIAVHPNHHTTVLNAQVECTPFPSQMITTYSDPVWRYTPR